MGTGFQELETRMQFARLSTISCGIALAATIALGSGALYAQAVDALPAAIVSGTCAEQGAVVAELRDATPSTGDIQGAATALAVWTSDTETDLRLRDLLTSPHAIVVGEANSPVACGDIGGIVDDDGDLTIGLAALDTPGYFGIADIDGDDDDDGDDDSDDDDELDIHLFVALPPS
jgi:hypothetical protein